MKYNARCEVCGKKRKASHEKQCGKICAVKNNCPARKKCKDDKQYAGRDCGGKTEKCLGEELQVKAVVCEPRAKFKAKEFHQTVVVARKKAKADREASYADWCKKRDESIEAVKAAEEKAKNDAKLLEESRKEEEAQAKVKASEEKKVAKSKRADEWKAKREAEEKAKVEAEAKAKADAVRPVEPDPEAKQTPQALPEPVLQPAAEEKKDETATA